MWKQQINKRCFERKKEQLQSVKYSCLHHLYYQKVGNVVMNSDNVVDMLDRLGY